MDALELAIKGVRYVIVEAFLKTLVPLIANLILEPLINEIQIQLADSFSNSSLVSVLTEVDTTNVFSSDASLLLGLNGRVVAEDVNLSAINLSLASQIIGELYVLNMEDIPSYLVPPPVASVPQVLGFRYSKAPVNVPDNRGDIEVNISTSMVNQALLALQEGNLLGIELTMFNTLERITFVPPEDANTKITLEPSSPPELVVRGGLHPVMILLINDYRVFYQRKLQDGSWSNGLDFYFSAELPIQLGEQGEPGLKLGLMSPHVNIQLRNIGPFTVGISTPEERKMLAAGVLPELLENFEAKLSLFFTRQPLVGFSIEVDSLSARGAGGGHLGVSINTGPLQNFQQCV